MCDWVLVDTEDAISDWRPDGFNLNSNLERVGRFYATLRE